MEKSKDGKYSEEGTRGRSLEAGVNESCRIRCFKGQEEEGQEVMNITT
jgi:hypothetical protein